MRIENGQGKLDRGDIRCFSVGADLCVGPWRVPRGDVSGRTHRSAPTRGGSLPEQGKSVQERDLSQRGGAEPAPYRRPEQADASRTAGCSHPALRVQRWWCQAAGRCRHRPLREERKVSATTRASGAQRSVCGADGRSGWESRQSSPPKGAATSDNPSVTAAPCQLPLHKGAFGTGDADCRVGPAGLLAMTVLILCHSEASAHTGRGNPSFLRWTGVRAAVPRAWPPPAKFRPQHRAAASSAPTKRRDSCRNHPSQRRTAERLRRGWEEWVGIAAGTIPKGGPPP